jgi:hypothetical protein
MKEVKAPTISFFLAKQRNYCGVLAKPIHGTMATKV